MNNESINQVVPLWKISDVARYLRKTTQAIYKMVERKSIPFIKIGRAIYFHQGELDKWIKKNSQTG